MVCTSTIWFDTQEPLFLASPTANQMLMLQGYNKSRFKSSFSKSYGRFEIVFFYKLSLGHMLND
jgi:hypothetical protein